MRKKWHRRPADGSLTPWALKTWRDRITTLSFWAVFKHLELQFIQKVCKLPALKMEWLTAGIDRTWM